MKLQDQVISLQHARRLKELGIRQISQFYWFRQFPDDRKPDYLHYIDYNHAKTDRKIFLEKHPDALSAFTVAELGEMLPVEIEKGCLGYTIKKYDYYQCSYANIEENFQDKSEANSRAKMLIYLIENKLMELPK